ncbi:MAG: NmrA family NAD(P)-binding protein [Candidatus Acidiferrales bacterium]
MNKEKRILVYLANGVQGGAVARQAISRGYAVRSFVRNPGKSDDLRKPGVEIVSGDLRDRDSLNESHHGMVYIVMQMPLGAPTQMVPLIDNAIGAIQMSGAKRVIVKMGSGKPAIETNVPAFVLNQIIEEKMRASRIPFSIIRPTMYLDNFLRLDIRERISRDGVIVYPLAAHQKIAWTSTDDAANAALTLLETGSFGCDCVASGPNAVDGDGLARAFSIALKREIKFQSLPLNTFEQALDLRMGAGMGKRVSATLRFIEDYPDEASKFLAQPFSPSPQLQQFHPTTIENWVTEHSLLFA